MKSLKKRVMFIMLVVAVFAAGFMHGCGTVHGINQDGKSLFTFTEKITRPLAEKQEDWQQNMAEEELHAKLTRAEKQIIKSHQTAQGLAKRDPMNSNFVEDSNQ